VYFEVKTRRRLLFYDKIEESKKEIPVWVTDNNILRYELAFIHGLKAQIIKREIHVELLYNEDFFNFMLDKWREEYMKIEKQKNIIVDFSKADSPSDFLRLFNLQKLKNYGVDTNQLQVEALDSIEILDISGHFKYNAEKKRYIDKVKEEYSKGFDVSDIQKEFDEKIEDAYKKFKQ
jgi:hypothetical protein